MDNLKIFEHNGVLVVDSKEIAMVLGKTHSDLLRDIRKYIDILATAKDTQIKPTDFFIQDSYRVEDKGRLYPSYLVTKKGYHLITQRLTGVNGLLSSVTCVDPFEEIASQYIDNTLVPKQLYTLDELIAFCNRWEQDLDSLASSKARIERFTAKETEVIAKLNRIFEANQHLSNLLNELAQTLKT